MSLPFISFKSTRGSSVTEATLLLSLISIFTISMLSGVGSSVACTLGRYLGMVNGGFVASFNASHNLFFDYNGDGIVDIEDYNKFRIDFGCTAIWTP